MSLSFTVSEISVIYQNLKMSITARLAILCHTEPEFSKSSGIVSPCSWGKNSHRHLDVAEIPEEHAAHLMAFSQCARLMIWSRYYANVFPGIEFLLLHWNRPKRTSMIVAWIGFSPLSFCYFQVISRNPMQLGSPSLKYSVPRWRLWVLEIHLFWSQRSRSQHIGQSSDRNARSPLMRT